MAKHDDLVDECNNFVVVANQAKLNQNAIMRHYQNQLCDHTPANSEASGATGTNAAQKQLTKFLDVLKLNDRVEPTIYNWLLLMKDKLTVNKDHYSTKPIKIFYIKIRIKSDAAGHVKSQINYKATNLFKTTKQFMETLLQIMEDPNKQKNALRAFQKLY